MKTVSQKAKYVVGPALLLAITFGICGPIQLYLMNITELWFSVFDIVWICILMGVILFGITTGVGLLLPDRLCKLYSALLFGISLGLFLQGNFVTTDYGVLDGRTIDWSQYGVTAVLNTAMWVGCIAVPLLVQVFKPAIAEKIIPILSICIVAMQVLTVGILAATTNYASRNTGGYLSDRGLYDVSSDSNVIVFILDTFDQEYFREILETDPDFLEPLDGFTYFDNVTGMYPTTKGALPYILTGQIYENEQPYAEYVAEAYQNTSYYDDLTQAGYEVGLYSSPIFVPPTASDDVVNYEQAELGVSSYGGLAGTLYKFVAFRYFPHMLKENFWFYSGEFDQWQQASGRDPSVGVYSEKNIEFYQGLQSQGLNLVTDRNIYHLIHLFGVHPPYTLNENVEEVEDGSANYRMTAMGVLNIVYEYIRQMKELEIYENATIVLMADHGATAEGRISNPLLLIKQPQATGPIAINEAPVCQGDYMATIMENLGLNQNDKYGRSAFDIQEGESRERHYYYYTWDGNWDTQYLPSMVEYSIDADSNDETSYHRITKEEYELGTVLSFYGGGEGAIYFTQGFSVAEDHGTWTAAKEATMDFLLTEVPNQNLLVHIELSSIYHPPQTVRIRVNGTLLYENSLGKSDSIIEFVIPKELCAEGEIELELELPDAISPAEFGSGDERVLAISVRSMYLEETDLMPDDIAQELEASESYELGTAIEFNAESDGTRYFTKGISGIETDSAWSLGTSGQLVLHVGDVTGDLVGEFQFKRIYAPPQQLIISSGGQVLYDQVLTTADEPVTFTIPASCVENGTLVLDLEYPGAVSPESRGESADSRELAFRFLSIRVDAAQP